MNKRMNDLVDNLVLDCGCKIFRDGSRILCNACAKVAADRSWKGHVDRASGAFDDYEKDPNYYEMGH